MKTDFISPLFFTIVINFFLWMADIQYELLLPAYVFAISFIITGVIMYYFFKKLRNCHHMKSLKRKKNSKTEETHKELEFLPYNPKRF